MKSSVAREKVMRLVGNAHAILPPTLLPDLPPMNGYPDVPQWHSFEHELWKLGEDIRRIINSATILHKAPELYDEFFQIAADKRGTRGRQSFVLLFCCKSCAPWAARIAGLLPDQESDGHVISALYKMRAKGFSGAVSPYAADKTTWIRKEAQRYLVIDKDTEQTNAPYSEPAARSLQG
jgi:hypothetical protein